MLLQVALMLVLVFSVHFGWFPAVGFDGWKSLSIRNRSVSRLSGSLRVLRASVDTFHREHVRTARAFGISNRPGHEYRFMAMPP
ncbi:MAG: hypothetical protein R2855_17985 [Thermomicrobiales bacterium]